MRALEYLTVLTCNGFRLFKDLIQGLLNFDCLCDLYIRLGRCVEPAANETLDPTQESAQVFSALVPLIEISAQIRANLLAIRRLDIAVAIIYLVVVTRFLVIFIFSI